MEEFLTGQARVLDPGQLARLAQRLTDVLDPDGTLTGDADHARRREFTMHIRPDGSGRARIELTAAGVAITRAWLDALAAPHPAADGERDRRTAPQRRYDAFEQIGLRAVRAGDLPDCGGTPATMLISLSLDQLESRLGYATTAHGGLLSVPEALRLAAEAELIPVVLGDGGGVLAYGTSRRVATPGQRRALAARDRGCSFPSATGPRIGHKPTTSSGGSTVGAPTWTTSPSSAVTTTASSSGKAGPAPCCTAPRTGYHQPGSTATSDPAGTPPTTPSCADIRRAPADDSAHEFRIGPEGRQFESRSKHSRCAGTSTD